MSFHYFDFEELSDRRKRRRLAREGDLNSSIEEVLNRSRRQAYIEGEHNLVKVIGHVMRNQSDALKMFQKLSSSNEISCFRNFTRLWTFSFVDQFWTDELTWKFLAIYTLNLTCLQFTCPTWRAFAWKSVSQACMIGFISNFWWWLLDISGTTNHQLHNNQWFKIRWLWPTHFDMRYKSWTF
jgi:hypothetical protein